jgi:DNA (cytosine-5)-methyltransferase 1
MGAFLNDVNHISLCAGIGGIDLGLSRCIRGLDTIAYVEGEAFAAGCLAKAMETGRLDKAPIFTDVRTFPFGRFRGLVDVISGGFPCQPFSSAGQRKGTEDSRHLWPSIKQGLGECLPQVAFFENVDGILHAKSEGYHCVLHHVLSDLEKLGYRATAARFSAREVGAPHRRRRWFILGVMADSTSIKPRKSKTGHGGESVGSRGEEASGMRGAVANAHGTNESRIEKEQIEKGQQFRSEFGSNGQRLANPERSGLERYAGNVERSARPSRSRQKSGPIAEGCFQYPNGPGPQHEDEPPRVLESGMGRNSHGLPDRVDRLRALGNAVVPEVAEKAFQTLWGRLHD